MQLLTKSKYLMGINCYNHLWTFIHENHKIEEPTVADQFVMDQGTKIGILAKKLYPDGIDLPFKDFKVNLEISKDSLKKKKPLFEASFVYESCFSRADILVPNGDGWHKFKYGFESLGDLVLHPSRIYTKAVVDMFGGFGGEPKAKIHGIAHITGGGIPGKLSRILKPNGLGADIYNPFNPFELMFYC